MKGFFDVKEVSRIWLIKLSIYNVKNVLQILLAFCLWKHHMSERPEEMERTLVLGVLGVRSPES